MRRTETNGEKKRDGTDLNDDEAREGEATDAGEMRETALERVQGADRRLGRGAVDEVALSRAMDAST